MLTKQEKELFREDLFRHLDGIAIAPIAYSLFKNKITNYILLHQTVSISQITTEFDGNEGYLNVALRNLSSQGWLDYTINHDTITVSVNKHTKIAFDHFYVYKGVVRLLKYSGKFHPRKFELEPFQAVSYTHLTLPTKA